jgi:hypothetical protein
LDPNFNSGLEASAPLFGEARATQVNLALPKQLAIRAADFVPQKRDRLAALTWPTQKLG